PQRAQYYCLRTVPGDDEAIDQNVVASRDCSARRKIEHSRTHCRELGIFQMNREGAIDRSAVRSWVSVGKNRLASGVQAYELSEHGNTTGQSLINDRVIN